MANLVICSDGTWNTPDDMDAGVAAPTNVVKIGNALAALDDDGGEQKKYYHPGVGTDGSWWKRVTGGGAGEGLDDTIKSGYHWAARNYRAGDNIFLFGFSRGAYTARSLAGMITCCGLLDLSDPSLAPDKAWAHIDSAFDCYRARSDEAKFKTLSVKLNGVPFHNQVAGQPLAGTTEIFFIGVWDTVGALGIPDDMALLNLMDRLKDYSFHDTDLSDHVTNARHAVAIDEHRQSFTPTLWTKVEARHDTVKQIWFPGVHSDVGGGYGQAGLSDMALKWMMDEAHALGLRFRAGAEAQLNPDSRGMLHDSVTSVFKALKTCPRNIPNLAVDIADVMHDSVFDRFKNPPLQQGMYWPTLTLGVGKSATVDVFARERWNATGLYLEEGATYDFSATGQWMDASIPSGPQGTNDGKFHIGEVVQIASSMFGQVETMFRKLSGNQQADFWWTKRAEQMPWFALVGVIANGMGADVDGNPFPHEDFLIGAQFKNYKVEAKKSGYLYCFANDAWQAYGNNKGSVSLTVKRVA